MMFFLSSKCLSRVLTVSHHRVGWLPALRHDPSRSFSRTKSTASTGNNPFEETDHFLKDFRLWQFGSTIVSLTGMVFLYVALKSVIKEEFEDLKRFIKAEFKDLKAEIKNMSNFHDSIVKQMDRWLVILLAKEQARDMFIEAHGKMIEGQDKKIESLFKR